MKYHSLTLIALAFAMAPFSFNGSVNQVEAAQVLASPQAVVAPVSMKSMGNTGLEKTVIGDIEKVWVKGSEDFKAIDTFERDLSRLNTNRGGVSGNKGFVGEHMEALQETLKGRNTKVINNNGIADLEYIGKNGHKYYQQLKIGYENGKIDLAKYKGQTIKVQADHPKFKYLVEQGKKLGVTVKPANITKAQTEVASKLMRTEAALTNSKTATLVPKAMGTYEKLGVVGNTTKSTAGILGKATQTAVGNTLQAAGNGTKTIAKLATKTVGKAAVGAAGTALGTVAKVACKAAPVVGVATAAYSVGSNIYDVSQGKKDVKEAVKDVAVDVALPAAACAAVELAGGTAAVASMGAAAGTVMVAAAPVVVTVALVGGATYYGYNVWKERFAN